MADALITYQIVIGTFIFLTGLLFAIRRKYHKTRSANNFERMKAKISWMSSR
jgi:uncharacterized membrane protein